MAASLFCVYPTTWIQSILMSVFLKICGIRVQHAKVFKRIIDWTVWHSTMGHVVTSIVKKPLVLGGSDMLVYSTILGGIGTLMPFILPDKVEFFESLQSHLRKEVTFLCGWRHVAYRSYFAPVQNVIDGDLCELYSLLPYAKQKEIATELDASPKEILKWVDEMRTKCYV